MFQDHERINRINRIMRIMSVSLAYHGKKTEFLNSFVSLTSKRIMRIIFARVCILRKKERNKERKNVNHALFKNKK